MTRKKKDPLRNVPTTPVVPVPSTPAYIPTQTEIDEWNKLKVAAVKAAADAAVVLDRQVKRHVII